MKIGDSHIMMADAWPGTSERGPKEYSSAGLWLYVPDCDRLYEQAVQAGCKELMPLRDAFWGDRMGKVKDPYGHCWAIATYKFVLSPEEIAQNKQAWEKSMLKS